MTIVAVNGGGNTPQGVQLERCFIKSWSTSGDADDRPAESLAVDPTNPNVDSRPMETPGPDDKAGLSTDDGLLLPAVQTDDAATFTAIAMAESGGNTEAHNPRGEDSLGLWQISVDQAQPDVDPDTFDCSVLMQWASGTAVATETLTIAHEGFWLI